MIIFLQKIAASSYVSQKNGFSSKNSEKYTNERRANDDKIRLEVLVYWHLSISSYSHMSFTILHL